MENSDRNKNAFVLGTVKFESFPSTPRKGIFFSLFLGRFHKEKEKPKYREER